MEGVGSELIAKRRGALQKKMFLTISQTLQENNCVRFSFLIKLKTYDFFKKSH